LSHNDSDHVGDAETLFDEYQQNIKEVYYLVDRSLDQNQSYRIAMSAIEKKYLTKDKIYRLEAGKAKDIFSEGQLQISVLFPSFCNNQENEKNNTCAIIGLKAGTKKIIFSGDAPVDAWKSIVESNGKLKVQILTVPHHGGRFANNKNDIEWFFENIRADYAIVSAGYGNQYKHPYKDVIHSFVQHGVEIFCTQSNPICCGSVLGDTICCGTIIANIGENRIDIKNIELLKQRKEYFSQGMCNFVPSFVSCIEEGNIR
jgi:competence protein ComEC